MTDTRCLALSARRSTNIYCTVNHLGWASSSSSSFSPSSPHWPTTTLSLSNLGQQIDSYIGPSLSEHLKSSVAKRLAIQRYLVTNHTQKKKKQDFGRLARQASRQSKRHICSPVFTSITPDSWSLVQQLIIQLFFLCCCLERKKHKGSL